MEVKINDIIYEGSANVVGAIENKMREELYLYENKNFEAPVSEQEEAFLSQLSGIILSETEKEELLAPTKCEEITLLR